MRRHLRDRAADQAVPSFYTSHEALLLPYEQALTRQDSLTGGWYDTSGHMLWVGDRTRFEGFGAYRISARHRQSGRHEVRPSLEPDVLLRLLDTLNPNHVSGRMTLITRYGHDKIEAHLPKLVRAVKESGHPVVWSSDPMHGNTIKAAINGYKTRPVGTRMLEEVRSFFRHPPRRRHPCTAACIHIEMTGQNVTECTGRRAWA